MRGVLSQALLFSLIGVLAGCAGPSGPLDAAIDRSAPPPSRKPLVAAGEGGALPPPSAMFEKAQSNNASERAAARAALMKARGRAGLATAPERISFLDLPDGVVFASMSGAAVAAPPVAGVDAEAASALRAGFVDALGGAVPRERAYLADRRFVAIGEARALEKGRAAFRLRVYDSEGASAGQVEATGEGGSPGQWLALGRRAAEKLISLPAVAASLRGSAGRGFASPGAAKPHAAPGGYPTASVPEIAPNAVAIAGLEGAPPGGRASLEAALEAALKARGLQPTRSEYAPRRISARVSLTRQGAKDHAEIRWLFTERTEEGERVLGEAKQARSLPRGAFDGPWGPLAVEAANAAADAFVGLLTPAEAR